MAYTAPTLRSTGDLITASIYNTDIISNIIAMYAGGMSIASQATGDLIYAGSATQLARLAGTGIPYFTAGGAAVIRPSAYYLDASTTQQDVTNTVTPTDIYSFSVPGGTLGTARVLRLTLWGRYHNANGSGTITFRVRYGATDILAASAVVIGTYSDTGSHMVKITVLINANGATNAQRSNFELMSSFTSTTGTSSGNFESTAQAPYIAWADLAEDSTAAKTLSVQITHSVAAATITFSRQAAMLELH